MPDDLTRTDDIVGAGGGGGSGGGGAHPQAERIAKGHDDPLGDTVDKVYARTGKFVIYTVDPKAGDYGRLRYWLPGGYEEAQTLRDNLIPVIGPMVLITDIVCGMRPILFCTPRYRSEFVILRERSLEVLSKAMQLAFDGKAERAVTMLDRVRAEVEARRDSGNKMRYILANAATLALILLLWITVGRDSTSPGLLSSLMAGQLPAGTQYPGMNLLEVLVLGAIGAFFSVSIGLKSIHLSHTISYAEMLYAGFVRVPIGVIAAGVVIMLMEGSWLLSALEPEARIWSLYLFGFLAGFSEFFVPNALNQVEQSAAAQSRAPSGNGGEA